MEEAGVSMLISLNRRMRDDLQLARNVAAQVAATTERLNLSAREAEVLALLVLGDSNAGVAEQLLVSHKTLKNHLGTISDGGLTATQARSFR